MSIQSVRGVALAALIAVSLTSCFGIIDKGRRKIAVINGKPVTRDDFDKVLRDMPAQTRPLIRTKGDMLSALQAYLDKRVRYKNAEDLVAAKKIFVPRELAEAVLRVREPEIFVKIANPEDYKMTQEDLKYMEEDREIRIDEMLKELEAEQGVQYRIDEAIKEATITITEQEYADEYAVRRGELNHPERVAFTGILVPGATSEVRTAATELARKLHGGAAPRDLVQASPDLHAAIIEAELENDPAKRKFASFWEQASGAKAGDVIGPVYIEGWTEAAQDAQGKVTQRPYPDGMLVCLVTGRTDQTPKTLEEAKPDLQRNLYYGKVMEELRKANGVQIFEDQLADPGMYDTRQ